MADLYDLGFLHAKAGDNLLTMEGWDWIPYPFLTKESVPGEYGPGHNSFTVGEEGETLCILHYRDYSDEFISGDPLDNPDRHAHILEVTFEDGEPVFKL